MSVEPTTLERSALERKDREELTTIAQALGGQPRPRARKAEIVQLILELTGVEPTGSTSDATTPPVAVDAGGPGGAPVTQDNSGDLPSVEGQLPLVAATNSSGTSDTGASPAEGSGDSTPAPAEVAAADPTPSEAPTPEPAPAPAAVESSSSSADAPTAEAADSAGDAGPEATPSEPAGDDDVKKNGRATTPRNGGRGEPRNGQKAQAQGNQGNQASEGRGNQGNQASEGRANQGNQGNQAPQGQGGQGQQAEGTDEAGNRRRRRRGRNRGNEPAAPAVEEFTGDPVDVEGLLDLRDEGYGFLRVKGSLPSKDDIYVSVKQARQVGLRKGDHIKGASRPAMRNEKNPALLRIDLVNGADPEQARKRRKFEDLTPLFPDEHLRLESPNDPGNMTARIIDLISPIGKGQRGLIVSPPKAGKTTIMKQIVRSIEVNNPEVKLIVLLVDERPEEVTDMRRWLKNPGSEAVASTFDRPAEEHAQVAELTIERAKRLVEEGKDVCIVLDGITRLARAYNLSAPATGRIMSGGVDSGALYPPKKFFGAARNVEEGGSLTILATALIETGSRMDEVIFEEFKGTGNMELRLDRRLAERRIYPAIDVDASSTRHEELLFPRNQLNLVWALRRVLSGMSSTDGGNAAALELLIDRMKTFSTNDEFLAEVAKNRLAAG
ncbi:MAG TPA: transcription termination factor Rho [Acidimicrobiales bacterium]|nr:transcription termination factor Rho [Acidimicrobiales bacterium]